MAKIVHARTRGELAHVRALFTEYAATPRCARAFRDFGKELAELPGEYAPPDGCLLLATFRRRLAACVALSRADDGACKMKRLFVRPEFRGRGIGRSLALAAIAEARRIGYPRMRLYTFRFMREAIALYRTLGFRRVKLESAKAICMELDLK
jgi:ribosomal protein S18 acetylase RimI-like enzyme